MSLYLVIFTLMIVSVFFFEIGKLKMLLYNCRIISSKSTFIYQIFFLLLSLMLCFRYGQGADYFVYKDFYTNISNYILIQPLFSLLVKEPIWLLLNYMFSSVSLPYEIFVMVISLLEMWMLHSFISHYVKTYKCLFLLLLFPTFYFTFLFSTLRQGLVMCIFLGYMLTLLERNNYFVYLLWCFIVSLIHISGIVFVVCLVIKKMPLKYWELLLFLSLFLGSSFLLLNAFSVFYNMFPSSFYAHFGLGVSYGGLLRRIVMITVVMFCYYRMKHIQDLNLEYIYRLFLLANIIFFMCCGYSLLSGRLYALWGEALEAFLIASYFLVTNTRLKVAIVTMMITISSFLIYKNINAEIYRSWYISSVNVFNYPYCNIFDKEAIDFYRISHYYR